MKSCLFSLLSCLILWVSDDSWSDPRLVTSVKPLALIANDLFGDLVVTETLLPANADPHHYNIKVSDRERLAQADVVIWLGSGMEAFLSKPLSNLPADRVWAVDALLRNEPIGGTDLHVWLNPRLVAALSEAMAEIVAGRFPELNERIKLKLENRLIELGDLDTAIEQQLKPFQQGSFIGDHPAYYFFQQRYAIKQLGVVRTHDEVSPSAKHLAELTSAVQQQKPACLLVSAGQHNDNTLTQWAMRWQLPMVVADIQASGERITTYADLMTSFTAAIKTCFSR